MKNITTTPTTTALTIDDLVNQAITLKLHLAPNEARLKLLTDEIKKRAAADTKHQVDTKTGGKIWNKGDGRGHSVVVSFPASKRISIDDPAAIKKMAGDYFSELFERTVTHKAVKGFAALATSLLPTTRAKKLIELATEESAPKINFELKEGA